VAGGLVVTGARPRILYAAGTAPWRAARHTPGTALIGEDRDGGRHVAADRITRDREAGSVDALRRTVPHERL
jgi:hypothetical protein